ncbi:MAG: MlaD family protein [Gemmatimonadota bacterium]
MRDPGIRDRGAEIQVGAVVLLAAVALVLGIFWISDTRLGGPELRLVGVAADARLLDDEGRVYLRGVEVGGVQEVRLAGDRVLVDLAIFEDVSLPADTRGTIRAAGFLGTQMVELIPGASEAPLATGDTIALDRSADLLTLAADLGDETNRILARVGAVLSEETVEGVQESSRALAGAMRGLEALIEDERAAVHALLVNLDSTSARLASLTGGPELERTAASLDTLTTRLAAASATFDSTSASLASITSRLDRGEGTLGRMLTDDTLYERLNETLANLQRASEEIALLSQDLRDQPEKYLRGVSFSVF